MRSIVMYACINMLCSKYFVQFLISSAKLYIMIKDQAGNDDDTNNYDQDTRQTAEPSSFPPCPVSRNLFFHKNIKLRSGFIFHHSYSIKKRYSCSIESPHLHQVFHRD